MPDAQSSDPQFQCPSCGAQLHRRLKHSKVVICEYCSSSIFLDDEGAKDAGKVAQLADEPSLFQLGRRFGYRGVSVVPLGRVRYDYGKGWWDEWWTLDNKGQARWMSVDEGDIAVELPYSGELVVPRFEELMLGMELRIADQRAIVTELNQCECIGAEGELPFPIEIGERYDYADLSGDSSSMFTLEYFSEGIQCFKGAWIDPFDVEVDGR